MQVFGGHLFEMKVGVVAAPIKYNMPSRLLNWNQKLSEETFVDESDSLKKTAAGAGLTDND